MPDAEVVEEEANAEVVEEVAHDFCTNRRIKTMSVMSSVSCMSI
jgi:hypothetical protein